MTGTTSTSLRRPRFSRRALTAVAVAVVPVIIAGLVIGALADADAAVERVPAAIVNADELVQQQQPDGTTTPVFAGRQLVTELTADRPDESSGSDPAAANFDWRITNAADAADLLSSGEVYAVLTIPKDFSTSILSLQSDAPTRAGLGIRTDESHSYLASPVAAAVGTSMTAAFGAEITKHYLAGVYESLGTVGSSLTSAADGADALADGAGELQSGLGGLTDGASSAASGAGSLSSGVAAYTAGADALRSGLIALQSGAAGLTGVADGVAGYTSGVSQLSAGIAAASAQLNDADPANDAVASSTLAQLSGQLSSVASGGPTLAAGATSGIKGVQSGISQSAAGASRLSAGSAGLRSGASALADGVGGLSSGASAAASGASSLSTGAGELAAGLRDGADSVPELDADAAADLADVVASPVELTVSRDNPAGDFGQMLATLLVPLALWLGALATFTALRPLTAGMLASTARTSRLLGATLTRSGLIALAQAVPVILFLHGGLGVPWDRLGSTVPLVVVTAVVFAALHQLLFLVARRAAIVVSLIALAVQVTAAGGIYPVEVLAEPFRTLSPLLPMSYAVDGMQAIFTSPSAGSVSAAIVALLIFGLLAVASSAINIARARSAGFRPVVLPAIRPEDADVRTTPSR